jgi:deoxyribonucleoside regulator
VTIVPVMVDNPQIILNDVCAALIADLPRYIDDHTTLSIAWGTTLESLSHMLPKLHRRGVSVLQLTGGYSRLAHETSALSILTEIRGQRRRRRLRDPGAGHRRHRRHRQRDQKGFADSKHHSDGPASCQTAIYSAGAFGRPSVIFEMGIIDDVQYAQMAADGCVGDCCGHFLNAEGGTL